MSWSIHETQQWLQIGPEPHERVPGARRLTLRAHGNVDHEVPISPSEYNAIMTAEDKDAAVAALIETLRKGVGRGRERQR